MDIIPASFELNSEECQKFIKEADPEVQEICKKIIDNTLHVDFITFLINLNTLINEYLEFYIDNKKKQNQRPIFIYSYNTEKNKSNYWILSYVIKYIKIKTHSEIEIILVNNLLNEPKLKQNDIIVFVDDCIYLGAQMSTTFEELKRYHQIYKFYLLVPYISLAGKTRILEAFNIDTTDEIGSKREREQERIIFSKNSIEIPCINTILTNKESKLLESYYNEGEEHEPFINAKTTYLVYFDHKLADMYSVPTIFYLGLVPNTNNSRILNRLEDESDLNNIDIKRKLTIIPLINHCHKFDKLKTKFDLLSPQCPNPPYKRTYEGFIKEFRNLAIEKKDRSLPLSLRNNKKTLKSYSIRQTKSA